LRRIRLRREAYLDIAAAFRWYEERKEGLGARFLDELAVLLERIQAHPEAFPPLFGETRRALLRRRFPYVVFFRIVNDRIDIIGCFQVRRDPDSWPTS